MVSSYYFNSVEEDRIRRGIAIFYWYKSFKNQCQDLNFSLDFDTNAHKVVVNMEKVFTDRAEYESIKTFIQREVSFERWKKSKFSDEPEKPYIEWFYTSDEIEKNEENKEEEQKEEKDDVKKDFDWKP